jgi:hypothetical protein
VRYLVQSLVVMLLAADTGQAQVVIPGTAAHTDGRTTYYAIEHLERAGRDRDVTEIFPMRVRGKEWDRVPRYRVIDEPILRGIGSKRRSSVPVTYPDTVYRWAFIPGHKVHIRRNGHATTFERMGWAASMTVRTGPSLDTYASYIGGWRVTVGDARADRYSAMDPRLLSSRVRTSSRPARR